MCQDRAAEQILHVGIGPDVILVAVRVDNLADLQALERLRELRGGVRAARIDQQSIHPVRGGLVVRPTRDIAGHYEPDYRIRLIDALYSDHARSSNSCMSPGSLQAWPSLSMQICLVQPLTSRFWLFASSTS